MPGVRTLFVGTTDLGAQSALAFRHQVVLGVLGELGPVHQVTPEELRQPPTAAQRVRRVTGRHGYDLVWAAGWEAFEAALPIRRVPRVFDLAPDGPDVGGLDPDGWRFDPRVVLRRRIAAFRAGRGRARRQALVNRASAVVAAAPGAGPGVVEVPFPSPVPARTLGHRRPHAPPAIGVIGRFDTAASASAVRWLADQVMPEAAQRVPRIRLHVIGDEHGVLVDLDRRVDVTVLASGGPDDLERVDVLVAPSGSAASDPTPILTAFAHRIPVVAHPGAVSGLRVTDGEHLLLASNVEEFSTAVQRALDPTGLRPHLTVAAHRLWNTTHRVDKVEAVVRDLLRRLQIS